MTDKKSLYKIIFQSDTRAGKLFDIWLLWIILFSLVVVILDALKIPVTNEFAQLLFGGKILHLVPSVSSFITTIIAVFFVGWLAHLYPVSIALKVQPVKAMQSE